MNDDHYIGCSDLDCPGCLPSDDEVAAMGIGAAVKEAMRRGMPHTATNDTKDAVLADADDYRSRSAATRAALIS